MKTLLLCILSMLPFTSWALQKNGCVVINSSVEIALRQALAEDVGLKPDDIDLKASRLELIDNMLIADELAKQYAREDIAETSYLDYRSMYKIYKDDNARNLIIKYIYFNKAGKKNIYVGSALVNDSECSVAFKGYLTLSREF
ncbi:hypothetical protein [Pantoea sp.]|uniref:hypothetical protein n=1 Tax=Pantoea sp. TaxID=69393 RepID=UPI00289CC041|nr:hypothetical protein [Pantoea sp.]